MSAGAEISPKKPLVGVISGLMEVTEARFVVHGCGESCVNAVERVANCVPVIIPAIAARLNAEDFARRIDGLLLTGGRANVEPYHYEGKPFPDDEPIDPARDGTALPLVRACVAQGVPVFGICRGIQEMNVALGGSLYYRVHLEPDMHDHRMPRRDDITTEEVFELRHPIKLTPGGSFEKLIGCDEVKVNSLHGQSIKRLAECLTVEAVAPDGVIEAVRLKDDPNFTVGVQWHAEWEPHKHALSQRLFEAFGEACRQNGHNTDRETGRALHQVAN